MMWSSSDRAASPGGAAGGVPARHRLHEFTKGTSVTTTATKRAEVGAGLGARYALLLISLIWPAQVLSIIGLLGGNAQAQIAIHFQTTQIAWFSLSSAMVGTFVAPFVF